jgi:D-3-phosphoglycerate dehydrogenase
MSKSFRIGVTRDFLKPDRTLGVADIGLELLESEPSVAWAFLAEKTRELRPEQVRGYDGLVLLGPRVTAETLQGADALIAIARFGVGYDNIDVEACTRCGVMLTITPDGVRRPVAAAVMTMLLALTHKLLIKDRLTRAGRWADKLDHMGQGVTGKTLGIIGLGNIGREVLVLAAPFQMRHLAYDPYVTADAIGPVNVELVDLETLLRESDYVAICCALTTETRYLINANKLALMKPTAYLVNLARGPVVDQQALFEALQSGQIRGAGLDVFDEEPIDPNDPILRLEQVIVTPHALSWTDESFRGIGRSACRSLLDVAAGRVPTYLVNRDVLGHPRVRERLTALAAAHVESARPAR